MASCECFENCGERTDWLRIAAGIWFLVLSVLGILGNLATLIVVPIAAKRKRHQIHKNFNSSTIFILNLLFVDLCHCLFFTLPQGILFLSETPYFGEHGCKLIMSGGMATIGSDMLSIMMISLSRCLNIAYNQKWNDFCDRKRNLGVLLILVWIPSLCFTIILENLHCIEPEWNCETGGCAYVQSCIADEKSLVQNNQSNWDSHTVKVFNLQGAMNLYEVGFPIFTVATMAVSYIVIWRKVRLSKKNFSEAGGNAPACLSKREMKITMTILILIISNIICWLPYCLFRMVTGYRIFMLQSKTAYYPNNTFDYIMYIISITIFESQYLVNFVLYVIRCTQCRKAFLDGFPLCMTKSFYKNTSTK